MGNLQASEKRMSLVEKEFHARMKVFARYQSQPEHDALVEGLLLEARLRSRIAELKVRLTCHTQCWKAY